MRAKQLFWLVTAFAILTIACNSYEEPIDIGSKKTNKTIGKDGAITEDEAVGIAGKFLGRSNPSRSAGTSISKVMAVTESAELDSKVSKVQNDTLAYVVNYANDGGFVVVSSKRIANPILAYSDKGNFSMKNEIANECFVKSIGSYLDRSESLQSRSDDDFSGLVSCYMVNPQSDTYLSQFYPFNKYLVVSSDVLRCIGCGPLAAGNILLHATNILSFQNRTFYMKGILHAYSPDYANGNWLPTPPGGIPSMLEGNFHPKYTYEQARDSIARLMTLLSYRHVKQRTKDGAFASSDSIWSFLDSIPQVAVACPFVEYDWRSIVDYLRSNHIVYMEGWNKYNPFEGHAWVVDGCSYCVTDVDDPQSECIDYYLHCDWGWSGDCNGYYKGEVFVVPDYPVTFNQTKYFAVKLNTVKYMIKE